MPNTLGFDLFNFYPIPRCQPTLISDNFSALVAQASKDQAIN